MSFASRPSGIHKATRPLRKSGVGSGRKPTVKGALEVGQVRLRSAISLILWDRHGVAKTGAALDPASRKFSSSRNEINALGAIFCNAVTPKPPFVSPRSYGGEGRVGLGDQPDRGRACVASQRFSKRESAPSSVSRERGKTQSRFPAALRRTGRESERRFEPYRRPLTPKALPRAGERSSRAMGYCFVIYRKCAIFRKSKSELRVSEPPRIEKFG
jgi:hypothetical protein